MSTPRYRRIASLKSPAEFSDHITSLGIELGFDEEVESGSSSPLGSPINWEDRLIGNRFTILPMEGWDGTPDGRPSELTIRRWKHFGESGAKLIWGGEAVAVCPTGRANPNQLLSNADTEKGIFDLRSTLLNAHTDRFGTTKDLVLGLQLTHSGRFARPREKARLEPRILYRHPLLDAKFGVTSDDAIFSDLEIDELVAKFVAAAVRAQRAGYDFVDLKHCHGYLGHEFLSARNRPGRYGGSFENRTRFLKEIVSGIRRDAPGLGIGVRLSAFDFLPYRKGPDGTGEPEAFSGAYEFAFGGDSTSPLKADLDEPRKFLALLESLSISLVCISAGSPYYNPHIQRPALFPPSDGYLPPEDPLVGCARMIRATAELKKSFPGLIIVGSGYSYLQEWIPNVGQYYVRTGGVDSVGLGRLVLSYHDLPADVLEGKPIETKRLCRTFSDCTTGPRIGLVSGCYPLDSLYKNHPDAVALGQYKKGGAKGQ